MFLPLTAHAIDEPVTIDGIRYSLKYNSYTTNEAKVLPSSDPEGYQGDIVIPTRVKYGLIEYSVTDIDPTTFVNNKKLTSLKIPYDVMLLNNKYYPGEICKGCDNLIKFSFSGASDYSTIDNVLYYINYQKSKCHLAFYPAGIKDEEYDIYSYCNYVSYNSFAGCKHLKRINVGKEVSSIKGFEGCDNLEAINVSSSNTKLRSIFGVVYDKASTTLKAYPTGKKGVYNIPTSVNKIESGAFDFCNIPELTIPENVTTIEKGAFYKAKIGKLYIKSHFNNYSFLESLDVSSIVYVYGKDFSYAKKHFSGTIKTFEAFWVEKQIKTLLGSVSFSIPKYQWTGGTSANDGNSQNSIILDGRYKIRTVVVNNNVIEPNADGIYTVTGLLPEKKYEVKMNWDRFSAENTIEESGTDTDSIYTEQVRMNTQAPNSFYKTYYDSDGKYYESEYTDSLFAIVGASMDESLQPSEIGYYIKETNEYLKEYGDCVGINGLYPSTMLTFIPYAIYNGEIYKDEKLKARYATHAPQCNVKFDSTHTTATITSIDIIDAKRGNKDTNPSSITFIPEYQKNEYTWQGKPITIKGLRPDYNCFIYGTVIYGKAHKVSVPIRVTTKSLNPTIQKIKVTATSIHLKGNYDLGDATLSKSYFSDHENEGDDIVVTDLTPNTEYTFTYFVSASGTSKKTTCTIKTPRLTFESQTPKILGNNSAIVCAKTNIGDGENGAGFEWRKIDAPDIVESKTGNGIVYDGVMEGRINNLNLSSYYKVRPFYKSGSGTTYYGEWIGFDPSDFSYFEPTVHTYTRASVEGTSARVRGVALQGTDDLLEQGFEYWADNTVRSRAAAVKQTIQATGQSMEAEITDLTPGYTYSYRAYAKTSKGTTYGETQQFTIPVPTAINGVADTTSSELQFSVKSSSGVQMIVNGTSKEECTYRISDITGNCMAFGKIAADGAWHSITATKPSPGIYIITVSDGNNIKSVKIVIK